MDNDGVVTLSDSGVMQETKIFQCEEPQCALVRFYGNDLHTT